MAVGQGHDAADGVGAPAKLNLVAHGEAVVRGEHAVDGDLIVCLRLRALAVGRDVDLGSVRVGAQCTLGAVIAGGLLYGCVYGEVLVERDAADAFGRALGSLELGVGRLEGGRRAAVFDRVLVAHAVDDAADGVSGEQEARCEGDTAAHEQEDAQVFTDVVAQLAREPPGKRGHRTPTNRARRRIRESH